MGIRPSDGDHAPAAGNQFVPFTPRPFVGTVRHIPGKICVEDNLEKVAADRLELAQPIPELQAGVALDLPVYPP